MQHEQSSLKNVFALCQSPDSHCPERMTEVQEQLTHKSMDS